MNESTRAINMALNNAVAQNKPVGAAANTPPNNTSGNLDAAKENLFKKKEPVLKLTQGDYDNYRKAVAKIAEGKSLKDMDKELREGYQKVVKFNEEYHKKLPELLQKADPSKDGKKKWTVIYYVDGSNNLDEALNKNVESLTKMDSLDAVNVVVRHARAIPLPKDKFTIININLKDKEKNSRGKTKEEPKEEVKNIVNDKIVVDVGIEVPPELKDKYQTTFLKPMPGGAVDASKNMGTEETFKEFLTAAMKNYPAEHYLVILDDHGMGHEGVCWDEAYKMDRLSVQEVESALKSTQVINNGKPVDAIFFDACLMASAEAASQLNGEAKVVIGSEKVSDTGFPAVEYLKKLKDYDDAEIYARDFVKEKNKEGLKAYETMSAVNVEKIRELEAKIKNFSLLVMNLNEKDSKDKEVIGELRKCSESSTVAFQTEGLFGIFGGGEYRRVDLGDFMDEISYSSYLRKNRPEVVNAAKDVKEKLSDLIIAERHGKYVEKPADSEKKPEETFQDNGDFTGLSVYLPRKIKQSEEAYSGAYDLGARKIEVLPDGSIKLSGDIINFTKNTLWEGVIRKLAEETM